MGKFIKGDLSCIIVDVYWLFVRQMYVNLKQRGNK